MLVLQRQGKTVDDRTQDFQQLGDTVVTLGFIDKVEENVVDAPADRGPQVEEFSVYTVECRLEKVPLSRVFRIKELEEVENEGLINISLGEVGVEIGAFDEAKEEFVNYLEVRPCEL